MHTINITAAATNDNDDDEGSTVYSLFQSISVENGSCSLCFTREAIVKTNLKVN